MSGKRFLVLVTVLAGAINVSTASATSATKYSRSVDVGPVRMNYQDFAYLIATARDLINTANQAVSVPQNEPIHETIQVNSGGTQISFTPDQKLSQLRDAPLSAEYLRYRYWRGDAPISEFEIVLSDGGRTIRVNGTSMQNVNGVLETMAWQLGGYTAFFGGAGQRGVAVVVLLSIAIICLATGYTLIEKKGDTARVDRVLPRSLRRPTPAGLMLIALLIILVMAVGPWKSVFPGAAIVASDAPLATKFAPEVGLCGLVIGVVGVVLTLWVMRRPSHRGVLPGSPTQGLAPE